jgi:hypothetical protein
MNTTSSPILSIGKVAAGTAIILMIPFVASQFTNEVQWTLFDYLVAGGLLFVTGSAWLFLSRHAQSMSYNIAAGLALFTTLFLVWANLAVGVVGSENNAFNLLYFGVALVVMLGALFTRCSANGLSITLFTAALMQASTIFIALLVDMQSVPGSSVIEIIAVNALFVTLFALAGTLFRLADRNRSSEKELI